MTRTSTRRAVAPAAADPPTPRNAERARVPGPVMAEHPLSEIDRLIAIGSRVMNEHTNDHGLCAACGSAWPCARVVLAESNLALL